MVLHELTTNAAKHGALSAEAGVVMLSWQREMRREGERRRPWLHVEWTERGGPKVATPKRSGFGTAFIREAAAAQLRGQSTLNFEPGGVRCVIEVPLEQASGAT
jgi:two-component sensor histidine kinase